MQSQEKGCSAALLHAQQRLFALRKQTHFVQHDTQLSVPPTGEIPFENVQYQDIVTNLPGHLGWGSAAATAVLRQQLQESKRVNSDKSWPTHLFAKSEREPTETAVSQPTPISHNLPPNGWVKLYPDIGLAMLRQEMSAPGRLWLMLRYLDQQGSGSLRIAIIKQLLTKKTSDLRLCGKRQLRNLLRDGAGLFWQRDKTRIWLRSAARVAHALGVTRLTGQPVALPVSVLTGGIGIVRAHLYASFHSGRIMDSTRTKTAVWSPPIARDTLTAKSGVGRVTQRAYEKCSRTKVQFNFAVGEAVKEENRQRQAWKHGKALFELKDYRGQQGKAGTTYLAWQLPNTYIGRHQQRPKGRQKRINRELKDLVMKGMPGTAEEATEMLDLTKRYYPNGKLAAKAYGRKPTHELYWKRHKTGNGRFAVWQEMEIVQ